SSPATRPRTRTGAGAGRGHSPVLNRRPVAGLRNDDGPSDKEPLMASVPPSMSSSNRSQDRAYHGEQQMGFYWGQRGYFFVPGPSGAGGHPSNASGEDGLAFRAQPEDLLILDNKSYARRGNVGGATAIDPNANLGPNLDRMITRVQGLADLPHKARIL